MAFAGFGAPRPATTGGNLFGVSTNTTGTTNPFGGGLFGQPAQQQQQQQQNATSNTGGGLFGATNTANTGGGLFGSSNAATNTGGGGLFGSTVNANNPAGGAGTAGGLFGQNTGSATGTTGIFGQQQQQQPQQQTGLFGSTANTNQGGGLFGSTANTNTGGGLFGSTANTGGLFGSTNAAPNALQAQATQPAGAFGGSALFGKAPSQMGGQQAGQQSQLGGLNTTNQSGNVPFTKSTKFNDLPEEIRKVLENIDSHICGRVRISDELKQRKLGEEPSKGQVQIRELHKELVDITNTIRNDAHLTQDLKEKVDQAVQDTIVATRIIEGFKNPQSGNTYLKDHASFPLEYFTRVTEQMGQRLAWYKSTIEQIERKLSSSSSQAQTPQAVVTTLQTQHATFLALANRTAALDAEVQKIKALYTQLWRQKTGSVRDPFDGNGKATGPETGVEFSMNGLNLSSTMR